jgi:hypothetical protein
MVDRRSKVGGNNKEFEREKAIAKKMAKDTRSERQKYGAARGVQKTPLRGGDWSQSEKRAVIRSAEASLKSSAGAKEPWLTKKEVTKLENLLAEMKGRFPHDAPARDPRGRLSTAGQGLGYDEGGYLQRNDGGIARKTRVF